MLFRELFSALLDSMEETVASQEGSGRSRARAVEQQDENFSSKVLV